jgi:DNA-binding transcriptional MerR regulator
LKPLKRRGNRRYYQHHEVLLVRRIRELLYEEGFTIHGARSRLGPAAEEMTPAMAALVESVPPLDISLLRREIKDVVALLRS